MSNCNSCPSKNRCKSQATCNIKNNPNNNIKKIIAVMSGKGGVGKSTVTALIAKKLNKMGYKVGILDSDITGPSIPRLMNLQNQRAMSNGKDIFPIESKEGIKTMSINYMVDNENQPIVWKGPMVGNAVKQFYSDVIWGELRLSIIDSASWNWRCSTYSNAINSYKWSSYGIFCTSRYDIYDSCKGC